MSLNVTQVVIDMLSVRQFFAQLARQPAERLWPQQKLSEPSVIGL